MKDLSVQLVPGSRQRKQASPVTGGVCVRQEEDLSGREYEDIGMSYSISLPGDLQSKIYLLPSDRSSRGWGGVGFLAGGREIDFSDL